MTEFVTALPGSSRGAMTMEEPFYYGDGPLLVSHAFVATDASTSMRFDRNGQPALEVLTGKPKHRAVAEMLQDFIRIICDDDEIQDTFLTFTFFSGTRWDDVRLASYDAKQSKHYYRRPSDQDPPYAAEDLDRWDPTIGHGGNTPIGRALGFVSQLAQDWVQTAPRGVQHRAVICLLSDGMNNSGPDGLEERARIEEFNRTQDKLSAQGGDYKGRIRLATVGYFQHLPEDNEDAVQRVLAANPGNRDVEEEVHGRALLKALAYPERAYFQISQANTIARFLRETVLAFG